MPDFAIDSPSVVLGITVENVRCFKESAELSLVATSKANADVVREVPWREGGHPAKVVPVAGLFGANASGKSSFVEAIDDMRMYVVDSFRRSIGPGEHWPFLLDPASSTEPSRYQIDLVLDGVKTEYGFSLDAERVHEEWAYRYPNGRPTLLFRRAGENVEAGRTARSQTRAIAKLLRPDSLLLSAAGVANHPVLAALYSWFQRNLQLAAGRNREFRQALTIKMLEDPGTREHVLDMLRAADLGIVDARVTREALDPKLTERMERAIRELIGQESRASSGEQPIDEALLTSTGFALVHKAMGQDVSLPRGFESLGTLVWLGLVGVVLNSLTTGAVLIADELDASLHPALVAQIVSLFQDHRTNPRRAQLIFNSHDPTVLGDSNEDRLLGRDQIWFTEKGMDGRSRLYPLTDFSPRKNEAIERRYLRGRYGATPVFSQQEFERIILETEPVGAHVEG
jgi:hypothetical protein